MSLLFKDIVIPFAELETEVVLCRNDAIYIIRAILYYIILL